MAEKLNKETFCKVQASVPVPTRALTGICICGLVNGDEFVLIAKSKTVVSRLFRLLTNEKPVMSASKDVVLFKATDVTI